LSPRFVVVAGFRLWYINCIWGLAKKLEEVARPLRLAVLSVFRFLLWRWAPLVCEKCCYPFCKVGCEIRVYIGGRHETLLLLATFFGLLCSPASDALAQSTSGFANGFREVAYGHVGTQLLRQFYFRYTDTDHHIRAIGISPDHPSTQRLGIIYQDINGDDRYFYNIAHDDLASSGIRSYYYGRDVCRDSCTRAISRPAGDYVFVLRGFYIYFHGDDHQIDQISIMENNGNLTVAYNDRNNDDTFICEVRYSYVPRSLIRSMSESSGRTRREQRVSIPTGTAWIRGFNFDFRSSDHEIQEIGVWQPGDGPLEVYYSDRNGDDEFDWRVRWAA
jgi:hypothetical protein